MIWMKRRSRNKTLFMAGSPSQCYTVHTSHTRLNRFPGSCGKKQALGWWAVFQCFKLHDDWLSSFHVETGGLSYQLVRPSVGQGLGRGPAVVSDFRFSTPKFLNAQRNENAFSQYGTFGLPLETQLLTSSVNLHLILEQSLNQRCISTSYICFSVIKYVRCCLNSSQGDMVLPRHTSPCLAIIRHAVTLALAHPEASPLAVAVLPSSACSFCVSLTRCLHILWVN